MGNLDYCSTHKRAYIPGTSNCLDCAKNQDILNHVEEIQARFYSWRLSDQQDVDFTWLVNTLKEQLNGSN